MRLLTKCEKEGCELDATSIVVNYQLGWAWFYCDDHEAEKEEGEVSTPLPAPPV